MHHLTVRQCQAHLSNLLNKALHEVHALPYKCPRCVLAKLAIKATQQLRCLDQRHSALSMHFLRVFARIAPLPPMLHTQDGRP